MTSIAAAKPAINGSAGPAGASDLCSVAGIGTGEAGPGGRPPDASAAAMLRPRRALTVWASAVSFSGAAGTAIQVTPGRSVAPPKNPVVARPRPPVASRGAVGSPPSTNTVGSAAAAWAAAAKALPPPAPALASRTNCLRRYSVRSSSASNPTANSLCSGTARPSSSASGSMIARPVGPRRMWPAPS
jgi:hypothetical protein